MGSHPHDIGSMQRNRFDGQGARQSIDPRVRPDHIRKVRCFLCFDGMRRLAENPGAKTYISVTRRLIVRVSRTIRLVATPGQREI